MAKRSVARTQRVHPPGPLADVQDLADRVGECIDLLTDEIGLNEGRRVDVLLDGLAINFKHLLEAINEAAATMAAPKAVA